MHNRILGDIERSKFEEIKTLWDLGIKRDILVKSHLDKIPLCANIPPPYLHKSIQISPVFSAAGENFENFEDKDANFLPFFAPQAKIFI